MKVIDIMQKVANKEIFKFRIDDVNYYVDKSNYIYEEDGTRVDWHIYEEWLNMNAEVIEDKKIEDIGANNYKWNYKYDIKTPQAVVDNLELLRQKINEIIEKINGGTNGE